jgi:hypothetical protein
MNSIDAHSAAQTLLGNLAYGIVTLSLIVVVGVIAAYIICRWIYGKRLEDISEAPPPPAEPPPLYAGEHLPLPGVTWYPIADAENDDRLKLLYFAPLPYAPGSDLMHPAAYEVSKDPVPFPSRPAEQFFYLNPPTGETS